MYFTGQFQSAYVTHDFNKAKDLLDRKFGLEDWLLIDAEMMCQFPDGSEQYSACKVGLVWQGGHQIELIQPTDGYYEHYKASLPQDTSDYVPRFHHHCVRRMDRTEMFKEIEELDLPFSFYADVKDENGEATLTFAHTDAREAVGHFLEYIWATPEMWEWQRWPKQKPVF